MNLTARILAALLLGLAAGFLLAAFQPSVVPAITATTDVIGTLWLNGIRMTVIPLVIALLLSSVTSVADPTTLQRVGNRTGRVFLLLIMGIVASTMALALTALQFWPPALRPLSTGAPALAAPPPFSQWLTSLIPANPIKAATDGAMLPLILFTLLVAFALLRLPAGQRQPVVQLFQTLADVMLIILRWVLWVAPAGVFAVSLSLAARQGVSALGALAFYVGMLVAIVILITLALYAVAVFGSGIPLRRFAAALAPAQSVAGPTLSSLAALPLLVDGAERILGYPRATAGLVLPLTVSILRPAAPVAQIVAALFTAQWNGIALAPVDLLTLGAVVTLMSFATPGVPNASFLVMIPVFQSIGLPIEGIGLMLAVDVLPDFAKTILNVTGHLTALTLIHHAPSTPHSAAVSAPRG
jgi:proton glutamate symport protein